MLASRSMEQTMVKLERLTHTLKERMFIPVGEAEITGFCQVPEPLRRIPDADAMAARFWDEHFALIFPWYLDRRRDDDVIVSASPSFLVGEACRRLGVRCLGTEMDRRTGRLLSPNCRGAEKIRRFREACGDAPVEEFYSDSYADRPMMELAESAYLMKNGAVVRCVKPAAVNGGAVTI